MNSGSNTAIAEASERAVLRTLRRRQWRVLRSAISTLVIVAALVLLIAINRDEVTIRDCRDRMELARRVLLERYRSGQPILTQLPEIREADRGSPEHEAIDRLRTHALYNLLHQAQSLGGGPAGACVCRYPHARLFGAAGRWVIIHSAQTRTYELVWMPEVEFQDRARSLHLSEAARPPMPLNTR